MSIHVIIFALCLIRYQARMESSLAQELCSTFVIVAFSYLPSSRLYLTFSMTLLLPISFA